MKRDVGLLMGRIVTKNLRCVHCRVDFIVMNSIIRRNPIQLLKLNLFYVAPLFYSEKQDSWKGRIVTTTITTTDERKLSIFEVEI